MGNQNSRSHAQSPTSSSVTASHGAGHPQPHPPTQTQHQQPSSAPAPHLPHTARRRESIQALSIVKAQAAPPSASLENAESHPTSNRPHSRGRSQTVAGSTALSTSAAVAIQLRAAHDSYSIRPSPSAAMGNEQSSQKGHRERDRERDREREKAARQITPPHLVPLPVSAASPLEKAQPQTQQQQQQQQQHQQYQPLPPPQQAVPSPQTLPVNVPAASTVSRDEPLLDPADASQDYIVPSSHFSRPPRLPLPIEEELYVPGSPIISPQDLDHGEVEGALPRRASMLSTTTADDDDLGEEFKGPSSGRPTVQTLIEWDGPGERIYVTGTFAGWNKKYKLHRNGPSKKKDVRSTYVPIAPGTHHLMFIVDNDMRTSDKLPTAVDYTNILVNYLEVSYDDIPAPAPAPADPIDSSAPVQNREAAAGAHPPQVLPPTPALQPVKPPLPEPPKPKPKAPEPKKRYHQNIPRYLLDLDAHEESSRFARANAMTNNLPTPPTLPGFLGKSILNGTTPMKDDSSVLIHPNHTVLNHLATSSIKDNILATSATTRYKQKFLTTIMYKPKEESPEHVY